LYLAGIIFGISAFFAIPNAFAIHESEEMTWQLITISSYPACSNYHYYMMQKYFTITDEYFRMYQFNNTSLKPVCLTEEKYESEYAAREDIDLLIVVYDRNKGRAELNSRDIGGFYSHVGDEWTHNHTIVFCDCPSFRFSSPVWILSHELSHFILYYLGYDRSITEEHVHKLDMQYDYCVEEQYTTDCLTVEKRLDSGTGYVTVMGPYDQAIGKKMITDVKAESVLDSPFRAELQKEITQWWLDGKITDKDYEKSLELVLGKMGKDAGSNRNEFFAAESPNIILTDPPVDKKQDLDAYDEEIDLNDKKSKEILEMNPFGATYYEDLTKDDKTFPHWFKTRALWWTTGKISTNEFLGGMDFLYSNDLIQTVSKPSEK
jgi:hypothetical protein